MNELTKAVEIPESAKKKILELLSAQNNLQAQLQAFLSGLQDGLGLEGNWNLDLQTWQFTKKEEPPGKPDSVPSGEAKL